MQFFSKVWLQLGDRIPNHNESHTKTLYQGIFVIVLVLTARILGWLQPLELIVFDTLLKLRPPEPPDDRITLIKITREDIERWGGYPIPQQKITELVEKLQHHNPAVIGLNLLGDVFPNDNQEITQLFEKYDNLVISEKVFPPQILASSNISPEHIGFVDIITDPDKYLRRMVLGTNDPVDLETFRFSFTIKLAQKYLSQKGYILDNGIKKSDAMRFGDTEIPLVEKTYGGYVGIDSGGIQTLINYRQHPNPFNQISIQDLNRHQLSVDIIKGKVIIVGVTDPTTRRTIKTPTSIFPRTHMTGVDIQGHVTSQIISAVLDNRLLLRPWNIIPEYLWFISFTFICLFILRGGKNYFPLISLTLTSLTLCYISLILGHWIVYYPFIPVIFLGLISWYNTRTKVRKLLKEESELRQKVIDRTFSIIHNGPLQTLSGIRRYAQTQGDSNLTSYLEKLDEEIRSIGEFSRNENSDFYHQFYLSNNETLDLSSPVQELFYQLFNKTIERDLLGFKTFKIKIRSFDPIDDKNLTIEIKRELCRFLEEMLCNCEKHARGASQLKAIGKHANDMYILRIEDNGLVLNR